MSEQEYVEMGSPAGAIEELPWLPRLLGFVLHRLHRI